MYKLKYADYPGNFHGFNLKPGYFYGIDTDSRKYITTSGWKTSGNVSLYFKNENSGKWEMHWIDIESNFQFSNLPEISTNDKMPFNEWLYKVQGITPEEWDESYSGEMAKQIENEYGSYFYDGLPQFVYKNL